MNTNESYNFGRLARLLEVVHNLNNNQYGRVNMRLVPVQPYSLLKPFVGFHKVRTTNVVLKELQEIISNLPIDFPKSQTLEQQGKLMLGYYAEKKKLSGVPDFMGKVKIEVEETSPEVISPLNTENIVPELLK